MATRRTAAASSSPAEDKSPMIPSKRSSASKPPAGDRLSVAPGTVIKLLLFTGAMITLPIGSYFFTLHRFYKGNTLYAAVTAAVLANIVLIGYIFVAVAEDQGEDEDEVVVGGTKKTR